MTIRPPFALVSLIAVVSGCVTAAHHGVSLLLIALNLAAWLAGLGAAFLRPKATTAPWMAAIATALLAATLISPGLEGVHRWIKLGLNLNVAALLLPLTLAALASLAARSPLRLIMPALIALILAAQPDASQAAAFAAGAVIIVVASKHSVAARATTVLGLLTAAVITAFRPDPLAPVPEVEGIITLAAQSSVLLATTAVFALAGIVILLAKQAQRSGPPALALAAYFAISAAAPLFGAYPVPLVGIGISPILGLWLGVSWMLRARDLE